MNVYKLPTGEMELGDFPARKKKDWLNIAWIVTHQCTMGCPYCIGWKSSSPMNTLIDKMGINGVVDGFERIRNHTRKNIYITISGGEPTMVKQLPQLCHELGKKGFAIELHTNLTTGRFSEWINIVDPKYVGQIMATYHGWRASKEKTAFDLYMKNFNDATFRGFTCVLKTVVLPEEVNDLPGKLNRIKQYIPEESPILPWVFIKGFPSSPVISNGAYPQAYTEHEKGILASNTKYRRTCQQMYCNGAGFFLGMKCDAGCGYAYMDIDGNITSCYGMKDNIGNFRDGKFNFKTTPTPCPCGYCHTPFWGLWYGVDPWNYIPGAKKEDAYYCRFGPEVDLCTTRK